MIETDGSANGVGFSDDLNCRIFLMSSTAGGVALTLAEASYCIKELNSELDAKMRIGLYGL